MQACRMILDSIFSNVVEDSQEGAAQDCELRKPDLELCLQVENAGVIVELQQLFKTIPKMYAVVVNSYTKEKMSLWSSSTTT